MLCEPWQKRQHGYDVALQVMDCGKRRIDILRSVSGLPATYPVEFLKTGGGKALCHNGLAKYFPFPRYSALGWALNERQWCAVYYWTFSEEGKLIDNKSII